MPRRGRKVEGFGLLAIIESRRVILPLKGVECDFSVISGIAEVSMTQIFRQDNEKPLDCEYLFPLPADASVYFCEADINGRTIRAQVRERQEARQIAAEKKAAGFRTALVEAERQNLFTLSLGNVQPEDLVIIRLKYFQTLRSLAGMPSIEIPFCPGIRYIPGNSLLRSNKGKGIVDDTDEVPDASRISSVRIDAEHPDAAYIDVRGTLEAAFVSEQAVFSPSHAIEVHRAGEQLRVSLSDKGEVPDRDFVLRWTEQNVDAVASRAWLCDKDDGSYALLEIRAPNEVPSERVPVDFYFLVDRSGSMSGEKWTKAAQALQSCMKVLGPVDRAMVTFFESSFKDFAEQPLPAQELLRDQQFQTVAKLGANGGTELGPALRHVLEVAARHSINRHKNLLLITDAQIGNESAIVELMKGARDFPVHCFGIDVALNDSLLLALCRQQGGTFHSLNPSDDIEQAVTSLGKTLGRPVLLDLHLSNEWELADAMIPNLYAGQIHYLSARASSAKSLELTARDAGARPVKIQFETQTAASQASRLHWCRSRIQRLVAEGQDSAAIALSVKSNLICPLTAFIAWDESEKVAIASQALVQPNQDDIRDVTMSAGFCAFVSKPTYMDATRQAPGATLRRRVLMSRWADADEMAGALHELKAPDELSLMREVSDICYKTGITDWGILVSTIIAWIAEAKGAERQQRVEALKTLLAELKLLAEGYERFQTAQEAKNMEQTRARIHQRLKDFVDILPAKK